MAGNKLKKGDTDLRVEKCYELRYLSERKCGFKEWIQWCHQNYGDKSEQQYAYYWAQSTSIYQDHWREKLLKQIDPAINTLIELLADPDPKVRQRAIDQIMKYTGNDVERVETKIEGGLTIKTNWGTEK